MVGSIPINDFVIAFSPHKKSKEVTVDKDRGASSPQFFQALTNAEKLKSVRIDLVKKQNPGGEHAYFTVVLEDVAVMKVQGFHSKDGNDQDRISLAAANWRSSGVL